MFTQSDVALNGYPIEYNGKSYKNFVTDNQIAVAKILQAALDMGNDPILLETGINKHTIGAANVMLSLGVSLEETILMMSNPAIKKFIEKVDADKSIFSPYSGKFEDTLSREADRLAGITKTKLTPSGVANWSKGSGLQNIKGSNFKVGEIYATKGSEPTYFKVEKDLETGKLVASKEQVSPNNTEEVKLIKSFLEFNQVAEEIKGIIPVIQMDNSMPKNNADLRRSLEAFQKMRNGETVDFTPLLERPLLKHYEQVLELMADLEETHFATEKGSYGAEADNNMINQIDAAFKKDFSKRNQVVETFNRMIAQGESNVSKPASFEKRFVGKVKDIIEYMNTGGLKHHKDHFNELYDLHTANNTEEYNKLNKEWQDAAEASGTLSEYNAELKEWIDLNNKILSSIPSLDNMFLKSIIVKENKDGTSNVIPD